MEFFEILSGLSRSKDIWGWILRFWPRSVLSDYEKSVLSLKNARQTSVWQIVSNFWFKLCFLCIFLGLPQTSMWWCVWLTFFSPLWIDESSCPSIQVFLWLVNLGGTLVWLIPKDLDILFTQKSRPSYSIIIECQSHFISVNALRCRHILVCT